MAEGSSHTSTVLRVIQLDAAEYDDDIVGYISGLLQKSTSSFPPVFGVIEEWHPEFDMIIKAFIWKYFVYTHSASPAQRMLKLKYVSADNTPLSSLQTYGLGLIMVCGDWFKHRVMQSITDQPHSTVRRIVNGVELMLKFLSLVNFTLFLRGGRYRNVSERVLGVFHHSTDTTLQRQVSFEFLNREVLWTTLFELLAFILPLINLRKINNRLCSLATLLYRHGNSAGTVDRVKTMNFAECCVCLQRPTHPRHIGCQHVFCYYCIQGNYIADTSYSCPLCGQKIQSPTQIQTVDFNCHRDT